MRLSRETKYKLEGAIWRLHEAANDIEARFPFKAQCLRSIAETIDLAYGPGVKEEFFLSLPAGHYSVNLKSFELGPKGRLRVEGEPLESEEFSPPQPTK